VRPRYCSQSLMNCITAFKNWQFPFPLGHTLDLGGLKVQLNMYASFLRYLLLHAHIVLNFEISMDYSISKTLKYILHFGFPQDQAVLIPQFFRCLMLSIPMPTRQASINSMSTLTRSTYSPIMTTFSLRRWEWTLPRQVSILG
jgi:hypothetical protein